MQIVKLRTYRAISNLTQQQFARKLAVSELSIIKYEGGINMPSRETMLRIYELTAGSVTPNDFFDLESISLSDAKNSPSNTLVAAGLMSGTSMDGIDGTLLITDGERFVKDLGSYSISYEPEFKLLLKSCEQAVNDNDGDVSKARITFEKKNKSIKFDTIIQKSTDLHAQVIHELLKEAGYKAKNIDLIGYHGQTLFHRPKDGITIQVGDGQRLADQTGITVVYDFRSNDVKHGGQGAPFAPLYHQALAAQAGLAPIVIANCGGIANITIIGNTDKDLYAYDCGPGNTLIDRFVQQKIGKAMDKNGIYGSKGKVNEKVLKALRENALKLKDGSNYLDQEPPKSLDVNDQKLIPELNSLTLQDGCATLEAFTAACIVQSLDSLKFPIPKLWVLAGGGWQNPVITNQLEQRLKHKFGSDVRVQHADQVGWSGQAMEAQIFAYLAVRSLRKLPLSLPGTTGVKKALTGGKIVFPNSNIKKLPNQCANLWSKAKTLSLTMFTMS